MNLQRLWLADFRNYEQAMVELSPRLNVVVGSNGDGKTNLLEAVGYLATLSSFRGAPLEALVRSGSQQAALRAEVTAGDRTVLIEGALPATGRPRVQVNRQPLRRARDLPQALRVSIFSPDDLALVKGGPAERRRYLDELFVTLHVRNEEIRTRTERVLRQRNMLLRQTAAGRRDTDFFTTLAVWDAKLAEAGEALASGRAELVAALEPEVVKAYDQVASTAADVGMVYRRSWDGSLGDALAAGRDEDLRRGTTTVGPHRDEMSLSLGGGSTGEPAPSARTHASQGEQRSLALALRLAAHRVVAETTADQPVLLLDDVFSELDAARGEALLAHLPEGQALLTTAGELPARARPERVLRVKEGRLL